MASPKQKRVSFRLDDVRAYRVAEYQSKNIKNEKVMGDTQFMIKAIDNLLESEDSELIEEIKANEAIIIKIIVGISKKDFESKEEYLMALKDAVKRIEKIIKKKK